MAGKRSEGGWARAADASAGGRRIFLPAWGWRKRGESPGGRGRRAGTSDGVAATSGEVPALGSWRVMRGAAMRRDARPRAARPVMRGTAPALHEQWLVAEGSEGADGRQAGLEEGGTRDSAGAGSGSRGLIPPPSTPFDFFAV